MVHRRNLAKFVANHVHHMLEVLYDCLSKVRLPATSTRKNFESDAQHWYSEIYAPASESPPGADAKYTVVGPLGERPLHVCFLSAYRFADVDFLGAGNYVADGILDGARRFVEHSPAGRDEAHVAYGKDYCAAVGSCVARLTYADYKSDRSDFPGVVPPGTANAMSEHPPYWAELNHWYNSHQQRRRAHAARQSEPAAQGSRLGARQSEHGMGAGAATQAGPEDLHALVTLGMYEEETIIFPVVAAGDLKTLHWLLQQDERAENRSDARPPLARPLSGHRSKHR